MEVAILPEIVQRLLKISLFEANPMQPSFLRSVGLDEKIVGILWTLHIISDLRNTKKQYGLGALVLNIMIN